MKIIIFASYKFSIETHHSHLCEYLGKTSCELFVSPIRIVCVNSQFSLKLIETKNFSGGFIFNLGATT